MVNVCATYIFFNAEFIQSLVNKRVEVQNMNRQSANAANNQHTDALNQGEMIDAQQRTAADVKAAELRMKRVGQLVNGITLIRNKI